MKIKSNLLKITLRTFAIFAVIAMVVSCNSDDMPDYNISLVPIDSVSMPDSVDYGKDATLKIYFELESSCHEFDGFTTQLSEDDEYLIGAVALVYDREDCKKYDSPKISNSKINFRADQKEDYIFKFWRGLDGKDDPIYLTKKMKVQKDDDGEDSEKEDGNEG